MAGIVFPVLTSSSRLLIFTPFVKKLYTNVCHQESYKCISINGRQFLVCSRCFGLYFGAFIASFLSLFFRLDPKGLFKYFILSLIILFADIFSYNIGLYSYSKYIASVTGIFSGSILFIYILNQIEIHLLTLIPTDEK
jgi:uncharacterized membrane protein